MDNFAEEIGRMEKQEIMACTDARVVENARQTIRQLLVDDKVAGEKVESAQEALVACSRRLIQLTGGHQTREGSLNAQLAVATREHERDNLKVRNQLAELNGESDEDD